MERAKNAEENLRPKVEINKEETKNDETLKNLFILKLIELKKTMRIIRDRIKKSDDMQNGNRLL